MFLRPVVFLVACILSLFLFAGASAAEARSAVSAEARAVFMRASGGDVSATDAAESAFRALSSARPADPVTRAYHGAALTLQGRDAWMPWTKMKKVEQGLARIDKALAQIDVAHETAATGELSPAMETRMTAIGTFLALPAMFHRLESAHALIGQVLAHPGFASLPEEHRARIHAWAAEATR